jgi:hypothetical protein
LHQRRKSDELTRRASTANPKKKSSVSKKWWIFKTKVSIHLQGLERSDSPICFIWCHHIIIAVNVK